MPDIDEHDKYEDDEEESSADDIQASYDVVSGVRSGEHSAKDKKMISNVSSSVRSSFRSVEYSAKDKK